MKPTHSHTENLQNRVTRKETERRRSLLCFAFEVGYAGSHSCKNLELHICCIGVVRVNHKGVLVRRGRIRCPHSLNRRFAGHFSLRSVGKQKCSRCVKKIKSRREKNGKIFIEGRHAG